MIQIYPTDLDKIMLLKYLIFVSVMTLSTMSSFANETVDTDPETNFTQGTDLL